MSALDKEQPEKIIPSEGQNFVVDPEIRTVT